MANPPLSTLVDNFGGQSINSAVWNGSSGSPDVTLDATLDRVRVACQSYYPILGALGPYNATGSSLYARITPAPVGNGSTQTIMRFALNGTNRVTFYVDGGAILTARVTNAGVDTTTVIGPYDPYQHAWWRLRESGGTVYCETAPDAVTWTTRASVTPTWAMTAVQAVFLCGYYGTEGAGMAAYVDHVGTTTSAPGQPNLNWPQIEDGWGAYWNVNAGDSPLDGYVEVTPRTRGRMTVTRGRQYELDTVRSGEANLTLVNNDGALDPTNVSGPWYGHIAPYQPYRRRAQWPASRNLLTQVQATGGDLGGYSTGAIPGGSSGIDVFSFSDSTGGTITASASAWQGSNVFQFIIPSGTAAQTAIGFTRQPAVQPGVTYTMQMQVRNVTVSTSLQVDAWIVFANAAGTATTIRSSVVTLTGSTTAGWVLLTVTGTAPADAVRVSAGVETGGTAAATCNVQVDGWQWERGAVATTWTCPGVWYPVYAGFMERWPSRWNMNGTYGIVSPTAVDAVSLLSQKILSDPLTQEINNNNPRFIYKLDDPSGSSVAADWTGNFPVAQLAASKYGAGSWVFGTQITSTDAGRAYTGSSGSVATLNNPNPGQPVISAATFLSLTSAGIKGPADPTVWVRMIAFRYTGPTPTNGAYLWSTMDNQRSGGNQSGSYLHLLLGADGKPYLQIQGPTGAGSSYLAGGATNCVDGDWHLLIFGYNQATQQVMVSQDGNGTAFYGSVPTTYTPTGMVSDCVGTYVDATVGNGTVDNFQGDISFICEFGSFFGSSSITSLYQAWKNAFSGESSDTRYGRILRYSGYTGPSTIQAGVTTNMGPARFGGQDAMSALQDVVTTENGEHYIDRQGFVQFKSRGARYNAMTPVYTFGERADLGEWAYEDCQLDFDSTHLSNQVTVTQQSTGQNFYATDATSITNYFPRSLTRTTNSSSPAECLDAANYLLSRYKVPAQRVSLLRLHPSASPALWPACLSLDLGMRVRVMRRQQGRTAIQVDCFIEQINWETDDTGEAWCTLQCSPADLTPYGLFAAFHATLNGSSAAGATSITINAGADTTNPAAAQIGYGQQLVLGLGAASQETVTVQSVSATSSGWATATITLQAATTKSHAANDIVCEPLPAGVADATTWDSVAKIDSIAFSY